MTATTDIPTPFLDTISDAWIWDNIEQIGSILGDAWEDMRDHAWDTVENYGWTFEEALREQVADSIEYTDDPKGTIAALRALHLTTYKTPKQEADEAASEALDKAEKVAAIFLNFLPLRFQSGFH